MSSLGKDFLSTAVLSVDDVFELFELASWFKSNRHSHPPMFPAVGRAILGLIFLKPSLRTRCAFSVAMLELGGKPLYFGPDEVEFDSSEGILRTAATLKEAGLDCVLARVFSHDSLELLASSLPIPVINGLSDLEHPTQAVADFFTISERRKDMRGQKMCFVNEACNVYHSLLFLAAKLGVNMVIAAPAGFEPQRAVLEQARHLARETGAAIEVSNSIEEAAYEADILYTDVWTGMGQEHEREWRTRLFAPYQVNKRVVSLAKRDVLVMHCLPARRGEEITDDVLDGPNSVAFDQAENRLHTAKAILRLLLETSIHS